jgi:hypothetical protein
MTIGGETEGVAPAGRQGDAQPAIATAKAVRASSADLGERAKAGYSAGLKGE